MTTFFAASTSRGARNDPASAGTSFSAHEHDMTANTPATAIEKVFMVARHSKTRATPHSARFRAFPTSAPICIQETSCSITLSTTGNGGNEVSGTTPIGADGSLSGAAIMEGTSARTGCVGTWATSTSTLTIDCGGVSTSQSCRATLV